MGFNVNARALNKFGEISLSMRRGQGLHVLVVVDVLFVINFEMQASTHNVSTCGSRRVVRKI